MKIYSIILHSITILLLSNLCISAQGVPIKWDEVPLADLQMKTYPADTNASAVILCDFGESKFNDELNIVFKRHLRVKILNTKGYEWGTHSVLLYTEKKSEFLQNIEGVTYFLNEQGKVEKTELDEDDIHKEKYDDTRTLYKFTLPSLKPGCVIDISYTINSQQIWLLRDWKFQFEEPVRWSEYRLQYPKSISYAILSLGYEPYEVKEYDETTQIFSGEAQAFFNESIVNCHKYRWVVKDAPALRDEKFITTVEDYNNKIVIQLAAYAFPGGMQKVLNDWPTLVNELVDHKHFGELIDDTRTVKKLCNTIIANCSSEREKIEALYNWVSKSIVCTESDELFGEQEPDDVIENKKGTNADITFLFLSLLKCIQAEADPVILSTRDNGRVYDIYPMISQFNYVLSRVKIDSQYYFIDPSNALRPMDILPFKVLNTRGLVIKEDKTEWTGVVSPKYVNETGLARITIHDDGSISGLAEIQYADYAALSFRSLMRDKDSLEAAKDIFETEKYGLNIDSVSITSLDSLKENPRIRMWFSSISYAQVSGDMIYINPTIIFRRTNNPLKTVSRRFPIDYGVRSSRKVFYSVYIPESFEIKDNVKNKYSAPSSTINFDRKVQADSRQIQLIDKFDIKDIEVKPNQYLSMKQYYSKIIDAHSEQIVLQRKLKSDIGLKTEQDTK